MPTSILISKFYHSHLLTAQALERCADRLRIEVSHNLADVLFLSPQCTMCLHTTCFQYGLVKIFFQWQ